MLSEEEKKAIERLEKRIKDNEDYKTTQVWLTDDIVAVDTVLNLITKLQKENEEKDKIIDLMADKLVEAHEWFYSEFDNFTKEDFIKYFERKVEEC